MILKTLQQNYHWSRERLGEAGFEPGLPAISNLNLFSCHQTMVSCVMANGKTTVFDSELLESLK